MNGTCVQQRPWAYSLGFVFNIRCRNMTSVTLCVSSFCRVMSEPGLIMLRSPIDLRVLSFHFVITIGPVQGLNFWQFIYNGEDTTFQDFGLSTFTTYIYRITVYNDIGSATSDPSDEVTTLAGQPTVAGTISAVAMDHISVLLNWTTPCKF